MEKKTRYFPVIVRLKKKDVAGRHPNLVNLSQGVVKQVGDDLVEDIPLEIPENPGADGVFSVDIKPRYLTFPGRSEARLFGKENISETPCRWAKAFCYLNGQRPTADFIEKEKGQAGIGSGNIVCVYTNTNETLLVNHVWIEKQTVKMKPLLTPFFSKIAVARFAESFGRTNLQNLQERVGWALDACPYCVGVVVHTLKKVWDKNGYWQKVFAVLPEEAQEKPSKKEKSADESAKLVGEIISTKTIVGDRVETGGSPEDRTPVNQGSAEAHVALNQKPTDSLMDPKKTKRGGKRKLTRGEADGNGHDPVGAKKLAEKMTS